MLKFFLTLRSVHLNAPTLSIKIVYDRLDQLIPTCNILIVTEPQKGGGFNYYIIVISAQGLPKNTYINQFRKTFPEFFGLSLEVTSIKSLLNVYNYILEKVPPIDLIMFIEIGESHTLRCNNKRY